MDFARQACARTYEFGLSVVRWRSVFSVPYIMVVTFAYCFLAFRAELESQLVGLYALVATIVLSDLLFSSTRDHSVMFAIVSWPSRDFFKTFSVALCALAAHELKQGENLEAFISSMTAIISLVVEPVYRYHEINSKIFTIIQILGDLLKHILSRYVMRPLHKLYKGAKYILLLRWIPDLLRYFRDGFAACGTWFEARVWRHARVFCSRALALARYWLCLHWCGDLARWSRRAIFAPVAEKLLLALDAFIYVFGCYWLKPLLYATGRQMKAACIDATRLFWRVCVLFGVHVALPLIALTLQQAHALFAVGYGVIVPPLRARFYAHCKRVEDLALIYVLGPVCKRIVDSVPERNPFSVLDTSDSELNEFLPSALPNEEPESGCESDGSSRRSSHQFSSEEDAFMPRGLRRVDIAESDSSDAEFALAPLPRASMRARRSRRSNRLSMASGLSIDE